jgi:hypothetical protein
MIKINFVDTTYQNVSTILDYAYESLRFNYEIEADGYELTAEIETEPKCYAREDYSLDEIKAEYMNDVPTIKISSVDSFDNEIAFTVDVHCEIMRLLLTDYHARKSTYLYR